MIPLAENWKDLDSNIAGLERMNELKVRVVLSKQCPSSRTGTTHTPSVVAAVSKESKDVRAVSSGVDDDSNPAEDAVDSKASLDVIASLRVLDVSVVQNRL